MAHDSPSPSSRRDFLATLSAGALGTLAACATSGEPHVETPAPAGGAPPPPAPAPAAAPVDPPQALDEWDRVRTLFSLSHDHIHMAGLLLCSHPRPVREAIDLHRRGLDDNPVLYLHEKQEGLEDAVRAAVVGYMGGATDDVALTDSTTMGLGLLYNGLTLARGDDVLTTEHDHYSTHEALRFATEKSGATLRKVALFDHSADATTEGIVAALTAGIRPRTRLVAVTWVHSSTGMKLPIKAIAEAVARENAHRPEARKVLLAVDGVHGFGSSEEKVEELGCDFFVAGCHKWIFGPRGTGVVWGRPSAWAAVRPTIPPFEWPAFRAFRDGTSAPPVSPARLLTPGGFHSFEHRWALPAAFGIHAELGRERVAARIHALNTRMKEGLRAMGHVTLHTPMSPALSAGLVCFEVRGLEPDQVVERLAQSRIIASSTPYRISYARFTPGLWNTTDDVDRALEAVRGLA